MLREKMLRVALANSIPPTDWENWDASDVSSAEIVYADTTHPAAACVHLTDTLALVIYSNRSSSLYGKIITLASDGKSIDNVGSAQSVASGYTSASLTLLKLSSTTAMVCYANASASGRPYACVLTVSGSTISSGTAFALDTNATTYFNACLFSDGKVFAAWRDSTNEYGYARILSISGTTISGGTEVCFCDSYDVRDLSVCALSSTKVIISFRDGNTSPYIGLVRAASISGTTITLGSTTYTFASTSTQRLIITNINSSTAIVCWQNVDDSFTPYARLVFCSGTTLTFGTAKKIATSGAYAFGLTTIEDPLVFLAVTAPSGVLNGYVLSYYGTTISIIASATIDDSTAIYLYIEGPITLSDNGNAILLTTYDTTTYYVETRVIC